MYIDKDQTAGEKKRNQKVSFYIDGKVYPDEAMLWNALGFSGVQEAFQKIIKKKRINMSVEVIEEERSGQQKYEVRCKDSMCKKLLRYDDLDIERGTISCMGRDAGTYVGISCPLCAEILSEDWLAKNRKAVK